MNDKYRCIMSKLINKHENIKIQELAKLKNKTITQYNSDGRLGAFVLLTKSKQQNIVVRSWDAIDKCECVAPVGKQVNPKHTKQNIVLSKKSLILELQNIFHYSSLYQAQCKILH